MKTLDEMATDLAIEVSAFDNPELLIKVRNALLPVLQEVRHQALTEAALICERQSTVTGQINLSVRVCKARIIVLRNEG